MDITEKPSGRSGNVFSRCLFQVAGSVHEPSEVRPQFQVESHVRFANAVSHLWQPARHLGAQLEEDIQQQTEREPEQSDVEVFESGQQNAEHKSEQRAQRAGRPEGRGKEAGREARRVVGQGQSQKYRGQFERWEFRDEVESLKWTKVKVKSEVGFQFRFCVRSGIAVSVWCQKWDCGV